jgi:hypothetical protein
MRPRLGPSSYGATRGAVSISLKAYWNDPKLALRFRKWCDRSRLSVQLRLVQNAVLVG